LAIGGKKMQNDKLVGLEILEVVEKADGSTVILLDDGVVLYCSSIAITSGTNWEEIWRSLKE